MTEELRKLPMTPKGNPIFGDGNIIKTRNHIISVLSPTTMEQGAKDIFQCFIFDSNGSYLKEVNGTAIGMTDMLDDNMILYAPQEFDSNGAYLNGILAYHKDMTETILDTLETGKQYIINGKVIVEAENRLPNPAYFYQEVSDAVIAVEELDKNKDSALFHLINQNGATEVILHQASISKLAPHLVPMNKQIMDALYIQDLVDLR